MKTVTIQKELTRKKRKYKEGHWMLTLMLVPMLIHLLLFSYAPMFGAVVAFKDFKFNLGIWGSEWVGFQNFRFLFESDTFLRLMRNTVGYSLLDIASANIAAIITALAMETIRSKKAIRIYQSAIFIPYFLSWIIVSYFTRTMFSYENGIINSILVSFGMERFSFYTTDWVWPFILVFFATWKALGFKTLIFYGHLLGADYSLYEAAEIDGCGYFKRVWYISLPHLKQPLILLVLLSMSSIFRSDYGLYYFIPENSGSILGVTDVFDSYVFRTLRETSSFGPSAAISFFQSIVGLTLVVVVNKIVGHFDKETALF